MKDLLLIHPSRKILGKKDNLFTRESLVPSLGLGSLAAYCLQKGIECEIIDLRLPHRTMVDVLESIRENRFLMVGITAFTTEIKSANAIAGIIKRYFPDIPIVVGGPHASIIPEETLLEFPDIDIVVIGEGEETLVHLIDTIKNRKYEFESIDGIAYREGGKIKINPLREPIADINNLPFPAWNLFEVEYYNRIFPVSTSRGCPYGCYFCTPRYLGRTVRVRGYRGVVDEIEWLVDRFGARRIQFADATFTLLRDDSRLLCEELIKRGLNRKIKWDCETRADSISFDLLQIMKKAGCEWVAFGVESGNERILKEVVRKGETREEIREGVKMAKKAGLKVRCFFIIGHYTETIETIKDTIGFALDLNPDAISFGLMVPNPGSFIRRLAEGGDRGMRILHNRWEDYQQFNYDCFELENIPLKELKRWQSRAYFTFYLHHPVKAWKLFFSNSAYNYNIKGLIKIPMMLLKNYLKALLSKTN